MESTLSPHDALASLIWQIELGATEAIGDAPVNRYELPEKAAKTAVAPKAEPPRAAVAAPALVAGPDPAAAAQAAVAAAMDLEALRAALGAYPHCELKRGARNLVFSDGNPSARVMIIGEAPGRDEDQQGKPNAEEIAMMRPFVARHVALVNPAAVVLMGNISCEAGLGQRGITRLRGRWAEAYGKPALPMFHPAYLLRTPAAKREAWADLLALKARLREMGA